VAAGHDVLERAPGVGVQVDPAALEFDLVDRAVAVVLAGRRWVCRAADLSFELPAPA
jgi:hypothetical protein